MARIAFLGIGNMGRGMALRLADAGHEVILWNRSRSKAEALGDRFQIADTPKDAAVGAEAVFAMVADDEAASSIWYGEQGALAGSVAPGCFAIECSTISHQHAKEFSDRAREAGFRPIDCPVTGLPDNAAAGELTLLVGADPDDLAAANPFLDPVSNAIVHFGPPGAGTVYKLMINLMGAVQIAAAAEGLLLAEKAGLDIARVTDTIATGQAASPQVVRNTQRMVANDHDQNITFSGALRTKDVLYGVTLATSLGIEPGLGEAALAAYKLLQKQGVDDLNESHIFEAMKLALKT